MNQRTAAVFTGTREEWCLALIESMVPRLAAIGIEPYGNPRGIRVAIAPLPATKLGVCYGSSNSVDGAHNLITVSTVQAEPIELAHTVMHELLHAFDDCISGHKGRWKRWANQLGIQRTGHSRSDETEQMLVEVLAAVGMPAQHIQTKTKPLKPPSQIRLICGSCDGGVWAARKSISEGLQVACIGCAAQMLPSMEGVR